MSRRVPMLLAATALVAGAAVAAAPGAPATEIVEETHLLVPRGDAVAAAIAVADYGIAHGAFGATVPDRVLLARNNTFPDALASGWVQIAEDMPILYTLSTALDGRVRQWFDDRDIEEVHVLGGEAAISNDVVAEIESMGITVTRHAGVDRIETALELIEDFPPGAGTDHVVAVRAFDDGPRTDPLRGFVDSMAASVASDGAPIVLSHTPDLTPATADHLSDAGYHFADLVGGTAALSAKVFESIDAVVDIVKRHSGDNRYGTAIAVDRAFKGRPEDDAIEDTLVVVDGTDPTGWAPGFAVAGLDGIVVLVDRDRIPSETAAYLQSFDDDDRVTVVCAPFTTEPACDAVVSMLR